MIGSVWSAARNARRDEPIEQNVAATGHTCMYLKGNQHCYWALPCDIQYILWQNFIPEALVPINTTNPPFVVQKATAMVHDQYEAETVFLVNNV